MDELAWQASNYGGLPSRKVDLLLEHGHLDLVIRAAEERGEWFCAKGAVEELCRSGEFARALKVMVPFVATGWRTALWAKVETLLWAGRTDEALNLVRPDEEGRASQIVCRDFADLLARAGRVDEAIDLLVPHIDELWIRTLLVEITEGQDCDERLLELIAPHAEPHGEPATGAGGNTPARTRRSCRPGCWSARAAPTRQSEFSART